MSVESVRPWDQ